MLRLNALSPNPGARKRKKRVGCGTGSGHGKTCCRGQKGQKARDTVPPGFEGGQMPLVRRLPKRGFRPLAKVEYAIVNVRDLARFPEGAVVDREALAKAGLLRKKKAPVKLLGEGELAHALTVQVDAASKTAVAKVEAAGGRVIVGGN